MLLDITWILVVALRNVAIYLRVQEIIQ